MNLRVFPYSLQMRSAPNARTPATVREGVLLRLEQDGAWGVADLAPFPTLGDADWRTELRTHGPLFRRALELAREDLNARAGGRSLLQATPVRNNYLITDYLHADLARADYSGQTLKIKGDTEVCALAETLNTLKPLSAGGPARLRIDFNSLLSEAQYEEFLMRLEPETRARIEYVEDPAPYSPRWREWNSRLPLAFDFQAADYDPAFADYLIVKPTRQAVPPESGGKITLASAMEHPVGLAHGLRIAQRTALAAPHGETAGFLTLDLFEETPFHRYFRQEKNRLGFASVALQDTGIGMTDELQALPWQDGAGYGAET